MACIADTLLKRQFLQDHLVVKFSSDERKEVLTRKNTALRQVKSYIDNNLNSADVNVIDPIKANFNSTTR